MTLVKSNLNSSNHLVSSGYSDSHRIYSGGSDYEEPTTERYIYRPVNDSKPNSTSKGPFIWKVNNPAANASKTAPDKSKGTETTAASSVPVSAEKSQLPNKKTAPLNLDEMARKILSKLTIILHDGCLYYYNGCCYQIIGDAEELLELVRSEISHDAFASASLKRFPDLYTYMRADKKLIPDNYKKKLRKAACYVSFQNGVLDLRNMALYPHSPKYLTFYSLDAHWTNDPQPQYFCQFLRSASGNDEQIALRIKESLGYLLSPVNDGKYFFVMGNAQNSGKSTLGMFLQHVLGWKLVTTKSVEQLSERFSLGNIQGKLLNLSMDLPNGKLKANTVSIIKQITGGDTITVEKKYDKQREVTHCRMRFLFASNYPVTIPKNDDNDAFWDRMIVIPFLYSIDRDKADVDFLDKLLREKDDIISACMIALGNVIDNSYTFSPCTAADQLKQNWRYREYDYTRSVPVFVEQCLDITRNPADKLYLQDLYNQYCDFCNTYDLPVTNYNAFSAWLTTNIEGCSRKRIHETDKNPMAGIVGIRLKNISENEQSL